MQTLVGGTNKQPIQMQVKLEFTEEDCINCVECGGQYFTMKYRLLFKKALEVGLDKDVFIPALMLLSQPGHTPFYNDLTNAPFIFTCADPNCNHEFNLEEYKNSLEEKENEQYA